VIDVEKGVDSPTPVVCKANKAPVTQCVSPEKYDVHFLPNFFPPLVRSVSFSRC